jgi:amino acid adenylation domain-containing protein
MQNKENIESVYPMSDIQKGMVALSLLNPGRALYHDQFIYQISKVDPALFKKALSLMTGKHETLRTALDIDNYSEEVQIVYKEIELPLAFIDLDTLDAAEQEEYIQSYMVKERENSFKIMLAPVWRATIFNVNEAQSVFLFQFHHAILDGWSVASFNTELFHVYNQLKSDRTFVPAKLKCNNRQHVAHELLAKKDATYATFWKKELEEYKRLDIFTNDSNVVETRFIKALDIPFLEQLRLACKRDKLNIRTLFFGAYAYALNMLSYENDIVVGIVTNNRPLVEDGDKILGCFLNTLPVRINYEKYKGCSWLKLFKGIEEQLLHINSRSRLTLLEISRIVDGQADRENPFFDVIFNYVDFHVYNAIGAGEKKNAPASQQQKLNLEFYERTNTHLDLTISARNDNVAFNYRLSKKLAAGMSLEQLHGYVQRVLVQYIEDSNATASGWNVLDPQEKHQLSVFNSTEKDYPKNKTVITLANELKGLDNTAVAFKDQQLSYGQFHRYTDQLARYLRTRYGVGPGDLAGIKLERSLLLPVAVWGVLKSGAAYVPIDVNYPEDRLKYIQADSNYKVCIDDKLLQVFNEEKIALEDVQVTGSTIAYAIYTSGSTGMPKGVLNDHAGLYNRLLWMRDDLEISAADVILHKTPYTFDVSVWELVMPAITGCKMVVAIPEGHKDPFYLQELIAAEKITILHFVPSMLGAFLEDLEPAKCSSLKHIVCSGEALPAEMVEDVKSRLPWVRIHNLYGPTEAAIDVTAVDLTSVDTKATGVSIGKPVANTRIFIVNKNLAPQPIGVPGELLIEGVQVARGYLNKPALTGEKFIASPFNFGQRVYRTGDLAKWTSKGEIIYLGRLDDQVKIRGNRIELGEIESRMRESQYVDEAAVIVKEDESSRKYLVAYVTSKPGYSEESLAHYLKMHLPEYMLPSRIIEIPEFPLTSSGKLNRKALSSRDEALPATADTYAAPRNETETALAGIWASVLKLKQVGIHDNFFKTGGDSILSIRLISRINKQLKVSLNIAQLYEYSTIAQLSSFITKAQGITAEEEKIREKINARIESQKLAILDEIANKDSIEDIYPMRDIQKGMILLSAMNPAAGMYHDQFVYPTPKVDIEIFKQSLAKLIEKHEALRTSFDLATYKEGMQIVQKSVSFSLTQKDLQSLEHKQQEEFIRNFMLAERQIPFDTAQAPLWRVNLFTTSPTSGILLFQFHHAILDGWSLASLYTELFSIYNQLAAGQNNKLDKLRSSNRQAVLEELFEKTNQQNNEFWKKELQGYQRLSLFTKNQVYRSFSKHYPASFKEALLKKCTEDGVSLKSVAYGALVYILKVLSNDNDFVVGLVSNNRPVTEDGDRILGCFLNTIPVRNELQQCDELTWSSYFKSIEEKLNSLKRPGRTTLYDITRIANEGVIDNSPFFDVLYNYVDFHIFNEIRNNNGKAATRAREEGISVGNFEFTNTALDISFKLAGTGVTFEYTLTKELKIDVGLDKIHECVEQVLTTYIHAAGTTTRQMELVSEEEKHKLLYSFNDTQKSYPTYMAVVDLFREQAIRVPDHVAITFQGQNLTYQQLDKLSNKLAHFLLAQGLAKGELVPVYLSRSPEMIISVLGILKAGGAYLPIDTGTPPDRISYMLEDSAAKFVLSTSSFASLFNTVTPLYIDAINYLDFPETETGITCGPDDLVYVIYTSGSTGKPKGVILTHGALSSRMRFYKNYYNLHEDHRILFYNSFGFDGCIEEYLLPFTTGATCVIAGPSFKDDLFNNLIEYIEEYQITKVTMPPVLLQGFLEALPNDQVERVRSLRHVIAGGDKLNAEVANSFYSKLGKVVPVSLYNGYGPTENTIDSATFRMDEYITDANVPIGKPIENSCIYILDDHERLLPIGLIGEICVSGAGLAKGYLGKPELTAEKFVPHPYKQGERMYKTGDTGYWLPDGNVVFLGRIDNQVKIRGYRIELGEIEATILQFGYVENAAVLLKEEADARKYLVAYVIPREGYLQQELYGYLKEQLPDYMLPGMIIEMESFPANINGKLDVKALPAPNERLAITKEYVAPTNETEEELQAIWQQLLGLTRISITDNFFQVGGDSLTVLKLRQRIQEELRVEVNVVDLFSHTTIRDFAAFISQNQQTASSTENSIELETLKF